MQNVLALTELRSEREEKKTKLNDRRRRNVWMQKRRKNETTSELRIIYVHRWVGEMEHSAKNKFQCVCFRRVMRISIKLCMLRQLFRPPRKQTTRSENEPRKKQLNLVLWPLKPPQCALLLAAVRQIYYFSTGAEPSGTIQVTYEKLCESREGKKNANRWT